jgi:hypothetical protein
MAKSVLVTMPAKLEAEKIASWLSRLVHNVEVAPSDGSWGIFVPQAALHRAQTALKKVIAAANPGRRIVARSVRAIPNVRFNASKGIPKGQIQWLVERLHVGTTHEEVEKEIRKRITGAGWTPAKVREAIAYAIKCHQRNRGVFAHVMRTIPNPNSRLLRRRRFEADHRVMSQVGHLVAEGRLEEAADIIEQHTGRRPSPGTLRVKYSGQTLGGEPDAIYHRNVQPPYRGPKQHPRPPLTDAQRRDIKEMREEERWRERERREDEAMDRARERRNPASSSDKRYNVWAYNRATGGSFELERNVPAKTAVWAYRKAVKQGLRPWCIDLATRNEVHPTRSGNLPNPVNKRARREARRAEIRLKESLGLSGRPLARRGPWTGGKDAFNEGQRSGSGYVRFWLWNDREWKINLRSSYDGVEGEPSLRKSAQWAADEEADKKNIAATFPGQTGKWKAGFILAFEKALADAFGPKKIRSESTGGFKDEMDISRKLHSRLAQKRKRLAQVSAARAKHGLAPNPSREVRLAREAKAKMLLVRIQSIIQAGQYKVEHGDTKGAWDSYHRAQDLWEKLPKGSGAAPATRRGVYMLSRAMVRLQNSAFFATEAENKRRSKKNPGGRYLIQAIRPKHRNWVTIDYAQDETRALLNALHRARLGKGVTYRVWDTDKVEEVWRGTGAEATIDRWKKIRPAGLVGANRRTAMHKNPRLSKRMHPLRENTMRLGDAMKYGRILLDAGIPIHVWDGSGWEVAIKPDDSYSTSSGRATSGGRRYLAQGAGLIKTWPITLLSDAIQPGAFIGVAAIKHFLAHRRVGVASNGRVCPNPLCKATARRNPGGANQNVLIRGDRLNQRQFEQVLSTFVHRWTTGNAARFRVYKCPVCKVPGGDPKGGVACRKYHPTIPLITDNQWVKEHAFHFTKDGKKLMASRHAAPAYMAKENPRREPYCRMCGKDKPHEGPFRRPKVGPMKGKLICDLCYRGWRSGRRGGARWAQNSRVRRNSDTVNENARIQHEQIVEAFLSGRKKKVGPRYWTDGTLLRVWGNLVARRDPTGVELYDAGYRTLLTKNILNTVLRHLGQGTIYQKGFTWYISTPQGNKTWPGNWTVLTGGAASNRGQRVARNGRGDTLTVNDIEQWVNNDEGLYRWWKSERKSLRTFVRENRAELERLITAALNRPPRSSFNRLTARESARLIRQARRFMGSAKDEFTSRGRHYRYGQASGVAAAVQLAGPRRAEVPAAMIRGRAMKAHRIAANPRRRVRRHAGLNGLMKNGDARKAMRFA